MTREWLDVPFSEKDRAKACGARWDPAAKRWYAPRPGIPGLEQWVARPDLPALLPGEDRSFGSGLFVDLVPERSWFKNARSDISQRDWERVRRMVTGRAGRRCEVPGCGAREDRAREVWLEVHERWHYDQVRRVQTLRRLVCLCTWCHTATHLGLAGIRGVDREAFTHLLTVTGMSAADGDRHVADAFAVWEARSAFTWKVDLSILTRAGIAVAQSPVAAEPSGPQPGGGLLWPRVGQPPRRPPVGRPAGSAGSGRASVKRATGRRQHAQPRHRTLRIDFVRGNRPPMLATSDRTKVAGGGPVFARSDRSRRLRVIGSDKRQDVGRGQRCQLPWRPGAVRTDEHQALRVENAVAGHEQLRSELASKITPDPVPMWDTPLVAWTSCLPGELWRPVPC